MGDPEPSGRAACSRILRPGAGGVAARAAERSAPARGESCLRAPGWGVAGRGPPVQRCGRAAARAVRARGRRGWSPRGVSRLCQLWECSRSLVARLRVMVPGGRKRRDSAWVGVRVPGVEKARERKIWRAGRWLGERSHRRRRPSEEPRE